MDGCRKTSPAEAQLADRREHRSDDHNSDRCLGGSSACLWILRMRVYYLSQNRFTTDNNHGAYAYANESQS